MMVGEKSPLHSQPRSKLPWGQALRDCNWYKRLFSMAESFLNRLNSYMPFTNEQWVEAVFHVPESFTQVSLQMTVRARCVP